MCGSGTPFDFAQGRLCSTLWLWFWSGFGAVSGLLL